MAKFIFLFFTFLIVNVLCDIEDNEIRDFDRYMGVDIYETEASCAMVGGLCVHKEDCISASTKNGLCPQNKYRGIECCFELVSKPALCREHLGQCMSRCSNQLQRPATDCLRGEVCCVLVR